jgi:hypothetical protein
MSQLAMSHHVTAHHVLLLGSAALDGIIVLAVPVNQHQHKVATHSSLLFELPVYLLGSGSQQQWGVWEGCSTCCV